jgi:hypothetical protein
MREDDSDILEYSIIKYQPASFLGLNGYDITTQLSLMLKGTATLDPHDQAVMWREFTKGAAEAEGVSLEDWPEKFAEKFTEIASLNIFETSLSKMALEEKCVGDFIMRKYGKLKEKNTESFKKTVEDTSKKLPQSLDPHYRAEWSSRVTLHKMNNEWTADKANEWLTTLQTLPERTRFEILVLGNLAVMAPTEALRFFGGGDTTISKPDRITGILGQAFDRDPRGYSETLALMPSGERRDAAIYALVVRTQRNDPEAAAEWSRRIDSESLENRIEASFKSLK